MYDTVTQLFYYPSLPFPVFLSVSSFSPYSPLFSFLPFFFSLHFFPFIPLSLPLFFSLFISPLFLHILIYPYLSSTLFLLHFFSPPPFLHWKDRQTSLFFSMIRDLHIFVDIHSPSHTTHHTHHTTHQITFSS